MSQSLLDSNQIIKHSYDESAEALKVVLTSGITVGSVSIEGFGTTEFARIDYSGTPVTSAAYVTLIASTAASYEEFEIFDSSGQTLYLATGAAASEVDKILIYPGGNGRIKLKLAAGTRLSLKAVGTSATVGEIVINCYGE